jgi:REP element-mobilizing transposase RayT
VKYDPQRHNRQSTRLKGYDYGQEGAYFVTICTYRRECIFGEIINSEMRLNIFGEIVHEEWLRTPVVRSYVELGEFVVMPNHIHGILVITQPVGTWRRHVPTTEPRAFGKPIAHSLSTIVGAFKSVSTRRTNHLRNTPAAPLWQARFHDVIIRSESALNKICVYIQSNPARWAEDDENPANIPM